MKTALALLAILIVTVAIVLILGALQPLNHTTTVTAIIAAPPDRVFALITDVSAAPKWRHAVQSVQILPPDEGRDKWIETLDHNQKMAFLATRTVPPTPDGHALREVRLNDPGASYGGTWTYTIAPGPTRTTTVLEITETGFIKPWLYRFMIAHVVGMTRNLDQYMHDLQAALENS
jgi:uncharacterized protein YndB with AHSA1/START domain